MKTDLKKDLRLKGFRATKTRLAILSLFYKKNKPLDAAQIKDFLDDHAIYADLATIYRFLQTFVSEKLIRRLEFQEGKYRYELASLPHHHHAVCVNCGTIKDIEQCAVDKLEKNIENKLAFSIDRHNLEFFGLCQKCQ